MLVQAGGGEEEHKARSQVPEEEGETWQAMRNIPPTQRQALRLLAATGLRWVRLPEMTVSSRVIPGTSVGWDMLRLLSVQLSFCTHPSQLPRSEAGPHGCGKSVVRAQEILHVVQLGRL